MDDGVQIESNGIYDPEGQIDHEQGMDNAQDQNDEAVDSDRPVAELFVKAAGDKMKNGSCPTCHRYFLTFYILREKGLIDLVVTTFLPENPPKEVLEFSTGKHYPLVKIHRGVDSNGRDITGLECDTMDEIEAFLERFDCDEMATRRETKLEDAAERTFEDLFKKFNQFLKGQKNDPTSLTKQLEKVDDHLQETGTTFMVSNVLQRADCYLLPTLQHIRVAGKAYKEFEIPTELTYLWRYMKNAYETEAFRESCPADREIISQYEGRASCPPKIQRRSQLLADDRTFSVPDTSAHGNGT